MRFLTGAISSSYSLPSASSTSSVLRASGKPAVSRGNSAIWVWLSELGSCIGLHPFSGASIIGCGGADRCARGWAHLRSPVRGELLADELRVVFHPADQRGSTRVLPRQAEEVEPRHIRNAATVAQTTIR